jgi:hypothetical protein
MERCPSWSKEHDWKSCRRLKRLEGSNPSLSAIILMHEVVWPLGQAVKTPPFHGGNRGSNPLGVTKKLQKPEIMGCMTVAKSVMIENVASEAKQ